jgi:thymidylate synthase (FAD)
MAAFVKPKVYLIAETMINEDNVFAWLSDLGGESCLAHVEGEDKGKLIELCGRRCYKSFTPGLNPNVTKIRTDSHDYLENIKKSRHGSVMEHASVTFAVENASRVFTHELVRHRAGTAFAQESLRYVRLTDLNMYFPEIFSAFGTDQEAAALKLAHEYMVYSENTQKALAEIFKDELDGNFHVKKKLTSAFRRFAPIGLATGIIFTANIRALRHLIEMRTDDSAEEEIRLIFGQVADIAKEKMPYLFDDYKETEVDGFTKYETEYRKV